MTEQPKNEGQPAVAPAIFSGAAARFCPLDEAGALIGVKGETLRQHTLLAPGRPALAFRRIDGRKCVQPGAAYDHLRKHAPRCRGLVAPPGYGTAVELAGEAAPTAGGYVIDPEIRKILGGKDPDDMDPDEVGYRLALGGKNPETVRVVVQAVRAKQNKRSIDLRAGKSFTPDEVVDMLRGYGELFIEEIDAGAVAFSSDLLAWIAREFGVVLAEKNTSALQLFENQVREAFGNAVMAKLRKRIDGQVTGVRSLEFTP
jgi:hypothetical protein